MESSRDQWARTACGVVLACGGCGDAATPASDATTDAGSSTGDIGGASTGAASSSSGPGDTGRGATTGAPSTSTGADAVDSGSGSSSGGTTGASVGPLQFVAVTFNTGGHANGQADVADEWYGNGLAWLPAVEQTTAFLADLKPDIIVFQEIFHSPDCVDIPAEFHAGYVCETWTEGDPTVAQVILGEDYQIACHLGKTDKCAAVKTTFGSFVGCDSAYCIEGLAGGMVEDCGSGSRVGRGVVELERGGQLTLVNFHGTSGFLPDDQACRVGQVDQVFVDLDGEPGANGERNLVLGDFNTDPVRGVLLDVSAQRWNDFVGDEHPFHFITEVGANVQPTYAGTLNIDHQVSDAFDGQCWHPGITAGYEGVVDFNYFDHVPAVCLLSVAE
ncbi:MAG: hypothetical protein AAF721_15645 [Myxococcota bacterium]